MLKAKYFVQQGKTIALTVDGMFIGRFSRTMKMIGWEGRLRNGMAGEGFQRRQRITQGCRAVSYTHLDVYKRQH